MASFYGFDYVVCAETREEGGRLRRKEGERRGEERRRENVMMKKGQSI